MVRTEWMSPFFAFLYDKPFPSLFWFADFFNIKFFLVVFSYTFDWILLIGSYAVTMQQNLSGVSFFKKKILSCCLHLILFQILLIDSHWVIMPQNSRGCFFFWVSHLEQYVSVPLHNWQGKINNLLNLHSTINKLIILILWFASY